MCVCSIISVISASYYCEANLHGFVKHFKFHNTWKCKLYLALEGAVCGATKCGCKCENIVNFYKIILSREMKVFVW